MNLQVISFTENGIKLSKRLAKEIVDVTLYTKASAGKGRDTIEEFQSECVWCTVPVTYVEESLSEWTQKRMEEKQAILFIGACGIAVRAIAPFVANKLEDSPVLVMDELGHHVIPLLSGHVGGANELALHIADVLGADPVITTATDLQHCFAVDLFAKRNGLQICEKEGIAKVSAKVLRGENLTFSVETGHRFVGEKERGFCPVEYPPKEKVDILIASKKEAEALIWLKPKEYVIGMGCKKDTPYEKVEALVQQALGQCGLLEQDVYVLASIDVKKEEAGLCLWAERRKIPFVTYSAAQLQQVSGEFQPSDFVKSVVGVDNVCERAAVMASDGGMLILKKTAKDGCTIAIAKRDWSVNFEK